MASSRPSRRRTRRPAPSHDEFEDDLFDEDDLDEPITLRELKRVRDVLAYARGLLGFYGVSTLLFALILMGGAADSFGMASWFPAALAAIGALEIVGAVLLLHAPLPWLYLAAGLSAFTCASNLLTTDRGAGALDILFMVATVALIGAIPRVKKAMRSFSGMTSRERLDRLAGRYRTSAAESDARQRRQGASRRESNANQMRLVVAGLAALALVGVGFGVAKAASKPSAIEPRVAEFAEALEAGRLASAKALCDEEYAKTRWAKAVKILKREGWDEGVELGRSSVQPRTDTKVQVDYDLPRGKLKTGWEYLDGEWRVTGVVFSKVRRR